MHLVFFVITQVLFLNSSFAATWKSVPNFFSQYATFSLRQIALGSTCGAAIPPAQDDADFGNETERPCNPALAPYNKRHLTTVDVALGGDYSQIQKYAKYLSADDKLSLAQSILNEPSPTQFTGVISIGHTAHDFNVWLSPLHTYYFSEVRNSVNPEVNLIAMREISLVGQYGHKLDENWSLGLQVAGFDRKFVSLQNSVFNVLADPDTSFTTNGQTGFFLEPGVTFAMQDPWHFRLSAMARELGFINQTFANVPIGTSVDVATGFTVPFTASWGVLDFLLSFTGGPDRPEQAVPWRVSSTYKIGLVDSFVGYDSDMFSFGANVGFDSVRVGLMFQQIQTDEQKKSVFSQASYVF